MAEFVLFSTIIFLGLSLLWTKSTWVNFVIKMTFILMTVFGAYLLFGPSNIIAQLAR